MRLIGIDLAWQTHKNPSAVAIGKLEKERLVVETIKPAVTGVNNLLSIIQSQEDVTGIAIDASLIINNLVGQRPCENDLNIDYRSRKASCHPTNLSLYPDPQSVSLSKKLERHGYKHLNGPLWQIECYPHPAMVECFNLPERLLYKKGKVAEKRAGQRALVAFINQLADSPVLPLKISKPLSRYVSQSHISTLKGQALKSNEDALDAIVCLYIAALYQLKVTGKLYGDTSHGYIWVPQVNCLSSS